MARTLDTSMQACRSRNCFKLRGCTSTRLSMARYKNSSTCILVYVLAKVTISLSCGCTRREVKPRVGDILPLRQPVAVAPKVRNVPQWSQWSVTHENGGQKIGPPVCSDECELFTGSIYIDISTSVSPDLYRHLHWGEHIGIESGE